MPKALVPKIKLPRLLMLLSLSLWDSRLGPVLAQDEPDASAGHYEQAVISVNKQNYKNAFIQVKNALRENPNDLAARTLLGRVYLETNDAPSAEKELRKALQMGADKNLAKPMLAKALLYQNKHNEIIERISAADLANDAKSEVLTVRGQAYFAIDKYTKAENAFDRAVRLAPNKAAPQLARARSYLRTNQLDLAEHHAGLATALEPNNSAAWQLKAELSRLKTDLAGALEDYNEVLRLDPRNLNARIGRAASLIDLKQETAALQDIDEILRETPNHSAALYLKVIIVARAQDMAGGQSLIEDVSRALGKMNLVSIESHPPTTLLAGVTRFAEGNFEEARIHLKRAIQMNPNNVLVRKLYAKILLQDDNPGVAASVLEPALKLAPNDPHLLTLLGNAYLQERRFTEATEIFESAVKLVPDGAIHVTGLAMSHFARGQEIKATQELESVLAADSKEVRAGKLLAFLYLKQKKYPEAMKTINNLLAVEDSNPTLHNLAGVGYLSQGDSAAARASFERALRHSPSFIPAQANLAKMDWADGKSSLAEGRYRKILDENPHNTQAKLQLSRIAEYGGRLQDAVSWLDKIDARDDKFVTVKARMIHLYLKLRKPKVALSIAERLSYLEPTNFAALIGLAKAQLALGKTDKAINTLRTTAVLSAEIAPKLVEVAKMQLAIKDIENAGKSLRQALRISPDFLPAIAAITTLELMERRYDEALLHADQVRVQRPESAQGDILTGDVLMRLDRFKDAFSAYQQAREKNNNAAVAARIFQAEKALSGDQKAMTTLEDWVNDHPVDQTGQQILANAYLQGGKFSKARSLYEKLLEKQPKNPDLLNALAWVYQQQGDPRALSYAERAFDIAPYQGSVLDTLGWVLVQTGQPGRALTYLRAAYDRASHEPLVGYHIGVALHRLGRNDEASQQLQKTLKLSENFDGAKEAKAILKQLAN